MGQTVGRMPDTWNDLVIEKDRVLRYSGEILAKVADSIHEEESLRVDCVENIDSKTKKWMRISHIRVDEILDKYSSASREDKYHLIVRLVQIGEECKIRMRRDYRYEYSIVKRFTKHVDKLGKRQREVHQQLQDLEIICDGNVKQFRQQFGLLRLKTFSNLKLGQKLRIADRKAKSYFMKRIYSIDRKNYVEYVKTVDKLIKNFEKAVRL